MIKKTREQSIMAVLSMVFDLTRFYEKGKDKSEVIAVLASFLAQSKYETTEIISAIRENTEKNPNAPTPSDIMLILNSKDDKKINQEIETKWQYFLDFAFSPYSKLDDWAYDAKKTLGWERVNKCHAVDLIWIKKEFSEYVTRQIKGEVDVIGDQRKWSRIGNSLCLESLEKTESKVKKIGAVLENKEEYEAMNTFNIKKYIKSLSPDALVELETEALDEITQESFKPDLNKKTKLFKAMFEAKRNQIVLDRIKSEMKNKPKLKVAM